MKIIRRLWILGEFDMLRIQGNLILNTEFLEIDWPVKQVRLVLHKAPSFLNDEVGICLENPIAYLGGTRIFLHGWNEYL